MKRTRTTPCLYSLGKAILAEGMVVHDWWKKEYQWRELVHAFGIDPLKRGVQAAKTNGETVPDDVIRLVGINPED